MLANPIKGEVRFEAEGATWVLAFPVNTLVALEEELAQNVWQIGTMLSRSDVSATNLRTVFCYGLQAHHDDLSVERAGELMDAVGLGGAAERIGRAYMGAFPVAAEEKEGARPRGSRKAGTGSDSTAPGSS